jgi:hypothetical protein
VGARVLVRGPKQRERIKIDIGRDRSGEFFDIRCEEDVAPEVLDVWTAIGIGEDNSYSTDDTQRQRQLLISR